ncbi:MAG: 6-bladed beta-propeller [Gemmatimonadaceae bacterium]|nr:6-bladed beta-propeller [Gemmatimonadaceae bacterium]MCW5825137.1 6-bladed beta-propeller [Gemmatimonadaceae bacterium]
MQKWIAGLALVAAASACGVSDSGREISDMPWQTAVDSTGDTIQVRITGPVPDDLVRTLVTELAVGETDGEEEYTFGRVGAVLEGPGGGLVVYDAHNTSGLIRIYDGEGKYLRTVGAKGSGPGEYQQLNGLVRLPNGQLVIWDGNNTRLTRYAADGSFLNSWTLSMGGWFTSNGLHTDASGFVYRWTIIDRGDEANGIPSTSGLIRSDSVGTVLDTLVYPRWSPGVPPFLQAASPDGRMMTRTSPPFMPGTAVRVGHRGGLVSGPGNPYVIYLLPPNGKPTRVEREHTPVPVQAIESSERRAQIERMMKGVNPSWSWTGPGIPSTKPAYTGLEVAEDGRIWVRLSTAGEPIPEAELPPVPSGVTPPPVRLTTRDPVVYDVFSPEGRLLGRVKFPPRTSFNRARGNWVWGLQRDEDDVERAVRMRVDPAFP